MRALRIIILVFVSLVGMTTIASATWPVIDTSSIAKLTDQLTKMQKQIDEAVKSNKLLQDQIDAFGKFGQISLPILNSTKIASQIRQDLQCLKPDLSKLMPSVEFEDLDWNSVCQAGSAYRKTLWLDPEALKEMSWAEREKAANETAARRENILSKASEGGLALGDIAAKDVEKTTQAADELEVQVNAAQTSREHLATIAQGQVLMVRTMAQQNQVLAQLLKVQSAFAVQAGVPVESLMSDEADKNNGGGQ